VTIRPVVTVIGELDHVRAQGRAVSGAFFSSGGRI
jgi:hypothetical protein